MVDVDARPIVADDVVYAVAYQGRVVALARSSGRVLWSRDMSSHTDMSYDAGSLYVRDENGDVWALARRSGAALWKQDKLHNRASSAPVIFGSDLVVADIEGYLHWLARNDGRLLARHHVGDAGMVGAPVVTLVGRPNVGKSTLFNRLTRSRDALAADLPGLTRDRIYGDGKIGDRPYIVVDTGGLTREAEGIAGHMADQARQAMQEADVILFLVDGRAGLTSADEDFAASLRQLGKRVGLTINMSEGADPDLFAAEFQRLGLGQPQTISSAHGEGVAQLMAHVLAGRPGGGAGAAGEEDGIRVAVVGRPNVGKSTLVNRMLGEERVVVFDEAGTTRDSIYIPYERDGQRYVLIDTAGVRRRARVEDAIEKFSIVKTLQAIDAAHVVIM